MITQFIRTCLQCQFLLLVNANEVVNSAIVYTTNGGLRGTKYHTSQGREVNAFLGIPYAKPPVSENRFKEAKPAEKWSGIRPSDNFGPDCVQWMSRNLSVSIVEGKEDCLYLNIFTPSVSNSTKLSVIVYIHGGAFMVGRGSIYKPYYLLDHRDVVFVTLNYRLGPYGFLSTEDNVVPGNNGLKDQVLALRWVNDNIGQFGGDKRRITLAGTSAGGASVHLHYMSPMSRGLFARGISESGTAFSPWALAESPRMKAVMLSASVGCPTGDAETMVGCLRSVNTKNLVKSTRRLFMPWNFNPFSPFGPTVETNSVNAFLAKDPYSCIAVGDFQDSPWMAYVTTEEGLYPLSVFIENKTSMQELDENWNSIAPHLLDYNFTVPQERLDEVSSKVRKFYLGSGKVEIANNKTIIKMVSDRLYFVGADKSVRLQASVGKAPVYFYIFGFRGNYSTSNAICKCDDDFGVAHADGLQYLLTTAFGIPETQDRKIISIMTNIWTSFANSSVPFAVADFFIPPVSPDAEEERNLTYFMLGYENKVTTTSDFSNRHFWNSLPIFELEKSNITKLNANRGQSYIVSNIIATTLIVVICAFL